VHRRYHARTEGYHIRESLCDITSQLMISSKLDSRPVSSLLLTPDPIISYCKPALPTTARGYKHSDAVCVKDRNHRYERK